MPKKTSKRHHRSKSIDKKWTNKLMKFFKGGLNTPPTSSPIVTPELTQPSPILSTPETETVKSPPTSSVIATPEPTQSSPILSTPETSGSISQDSASDNSDLFFADESFLESFKEGASFTDDNTLVVSPSSTSSSPSSTSFTQTTPEKFEGGSDNWNTMGFLNKMNPLNWLPATNKPSSSAPIIAAPVVLTPATTTNPTPATTTNPTPANTTTTPANTTTTTTTTNNNVNNNNNMVGGKSLKKTLASIPAVLLYANPFYKHKSRRHRKRGHGTKKRKHHK